MNFIEHTLYKTNNKIATKEESTNLLKNIKTLKQNQNSILSKNSKSTYDISKVLEREISKEKINDKNIIDRLK